MNVKVLVALACCSLAAAVPALAGSAPPPVVATALAVGTMKATTVHAQSGSMIFEQFTVKPGGSFGWHKHGAAVAVVVASGTLTVFDATVNGCQPFKVGHGQSFVEPANHVHLARNDGTTPARVYAVYLGVPASSQANAGAAQPAGCKA
jgi:quercetin dioxygenase-like cupin family protein